MFEVTYLFIIYKHLFIYIFFYQKNIFYGLRREIERKYKILKYVILESVRSIMRFNTENPRIICTCLQEPQGDADPDP